MPDNITPYDMLADLTKAYDNVRAFNAAGFADDESRRNARVLRATRVRFEMFTPIAELALKIDHSALDNAVAELGRCIAQNKDRLIRNAISLVLGEEWNIDDVLPRMTCVVDGRARIETFTLDGIPIIEFRPMVMSDRIEASEVHGCPYDTNGDGNCGRPMCPYCGERKAPGYDQSHRINASINYRILTQPHQWHKPDQQPKPASSSSTPPSTSASPSPATSSPSSPTTLPTTG